MEAKMDSRARQTVVKYVGENNEANCGYCKSTSFHSYGMWAYRMTVEDYQHLIDRGWRRSGSYCYKPIMEKTCCPQYAIRCNALVFNLSKSQKKVIKKFNRYIVTDERKSTILECFQNSTASKRTKMSPKEGSSITEQWTKQLRVEGYTRSTAASEGTYNDVNTGDTEGNCVNPEDSISSVKKQHETQKTEDHDIISHQNKAKVLRKERKRIKLLQEGYSEEEVNVKLNSNIQQGKSLEEFLNETLSSDSIHKLKVKLVKCASPTMEESFKESYELYRKYTFSVHNSTDDCSFNQYRQFIVDSPLMPCKPQQGPPNGYGSFHQQYWLDEKLIAVGVIDILPKCISSVYFFYDPDLAFLSLGTYSLLREIAMVRSIHQQNPLMEFCYMGYYIHSCLKMQYKANIKPAYLLCPEVFTWHPFEECKQKLEQQKYCRLTPDISANDDEDNVNIDEVSVLFKWEVSLYPHYKRKNDRKRENEDNEVFQFAKLVGRGRIKSILLYRADN